MKLFLPVLVLFWVSSNPAMCQQSGEKSLQPTHATVNLSLDLNSRDLMASAMNQVEGSVSAVVYKFDDPKLFPILLKTVQRGVKLQVICDAKEAKKNASLIGDLAQAGAEVRYWPRKQGKLHAKFVICDENRVLTGSWNWTKSAGGKNLELLMDIKDDHTVKTFVGVFARLWEMSQPQK